MKNKRTSHFSLLYIFLAEFFEKKKYFIVVIRVLIQFSCHREVICVDNMTGFPCVLCLKHFINKLIGTMYHVCSMIKVYQGSHNFSKIESISNFNKY